MKTSFTFLFVLSFLTLLSAQQDKVFFSLEYSPNFTNSTEPLWRHGDDSYLFASNLFAKAGYHLAGGLYANAGVGILTTKDYSVFDFGLVDVDRIEALRKNTYVVAPVGFTYFLGSFFVSPEIGIGLNVANRQNDVFYYTDGSIAENKWTDVHNLNQVNRMTYPLFLSVGCEIPFSSWSLMLGAKGYYALSPTGDTAYNSGHYYGFGLLTGVKF